MSKRIANCRGRTTVHFGRVNYGRWSTMKITRTIKEEEFERRKQALQDMISAPLKIFRHRHQNR